MTRNLATVNWTNILAFTAAIAGLGAFWIACRESVRNNKVILRLKEFTFASITEATGEFDELKVTLLNRGIQLQNVSMGLAFLGPGKSGTFYCPIPLSRHSTGVGNTFPRGATAEFLLTSKDKEARQFLAMVRDMREQEPCICVYHNSFLAVEFPLVRKGDGLRERWNQWSFRFAIKRRIGDGVEGKGVFKNYNLPLFQVRSHALRYFLDGLAKIREQNSSSA